MINYSRTAKIKSYHWERLDILKNLIKGKEITFEEQSTIQGTAKRSSIVPPRQDISQLKKASGL